MLALVGTNNMLLNHPSGANGIHKPQFSATTAVHKHKTNKNVNKATQRRLLSSCCPVVQATRATSSVEEVEGWKTDFSLLPRQT